MIPKIKYTEEDEAVYELIEDPAWFGEWVRREKVPNYELDNYQKAILYDNSHYISVCAGRSVGKTEILEVLMAWVTVFFKYEEANAPESLYLVPNKAQLDPVFLRISQFFRTHWFLKLFVERGDINFSEHKINIRNGPDNSVGAMLRARIAGLSADSNVIGLHVPYIIVDEAQSFPWVAWNSTQMALMEWIETYQMIVSGVPNGLRDQNVLYDCDQLNDKFMDSRHHVSRTQSRRYSQKSYSDHLKQYGGEQSDEVAHMIYGTHGSPAYAVFDRALMLLEDYPISVSRINDFQWKQSGGKYYEILHVPEPDRVRYDLILAAIDVGYTEPTCINIVVRDKERQRFKIISRLWLRQISSPFQAQIIDWLDNIYDFDKLTIDAGSHGLALIQTLMDDSRYTSKNFNERILPVDFNGTVLIGFKDDPDKTEIKDRVKRFAIGRLQQWLQNDHFLIPSVDDEELLSELERVSFTRDQSGQPVYKVMSSRGGSTTDDHNLATLICWAYGWYFEHFWPSPKKEKEVQLIDSSWGPTKEHIPIYRKVG